MIREELLKILLCPVDQQPLTLADADLLDRVNDAIRDGQLANQSGQQVEDLIDQGLVSQNRERLYLVYEDIPKLVAEEAVSLAAFTGQTDASNPESSS